MFPFSWVMPWTVSLPWSLFKPSAGPSALSIAHEFISLRFLGTLVQVACLALHHNFHEKHAIILSDTAPGCGVMWALLLFFSLYPSAPIYPHNAPGTSEDRRLYSTAYDPSACSWRLRWIVNSTVASTHLHSQGFRRTWRALQGELCVPYLHSDSRLQALFRITRPVLFMLMNPSWYFQQTSYQEIPPKENTDVNTRGQKKWLAAKHTSSYQATSPTSWHSSLQLSLGFKERTTPS